MTTSASDMQWDRQSLRKNFFILRKGFITFSWIILTDRLVGGATKAGVLNLWYAKVFRVVRE